MIKNIFFNTKQAIKDFSDDPINNLGIILPVVIALTALISGIVTYVMFIVNGGYSAQVAATEKYGLFRGYSQKFTSGTTEMIVSGVVGKILFALVVIEFFIMMINYFRSADKLKRIIMIIDMPILVIQIFLTCVFWRLGENIIGLKVIDGVTEFFKNMTISPKLILIIYGVITIVAFLIFLIPILITQECRRILGHSLLAIVFSTMLVPLVFLFLQNVIPLVTGIVAIVIITLVAYLIGIFMLGGREGNSSSDFALSKGDNHLNVNNTKNYEMKASNTNKIQNQKERKIEYNTVFWRDKGGYGMLTPQEDCIYFKDSLGSKEFACTVSEFEKGKVAIVNKGSRVMNIAGCKSPER